MNNVTGKPIKDITFEGYVFTIPAGVSLCWDKFGEFIFSKIYPQTATGISPVVLAKASQWKGDRYVDVRRFELNAGLIPKRADLLKIGKQRGVDAETLEQWREDEAIDNKEIARVINELAVPDLIKYPAPAEEVTDTVVEETAEAVLNAPDTSNTEVTATAKPGETQVSAPAGDTTPTTNKAAPKTGGKGGTKKTAAAPKAAARTPKTPKTPVQK